MNSLINKKDFSQFLEKLGRDHELIGPVKKGSLLVFDRFESFDEVILDRQTDHPAKKYLLPDQECMFRFSKGKTEADAEAVKRALLIKPCDANAILNLDKVFLDEHPDTNYKKRRENTILLVFRCAEPGENCFCTSVNADETPNFDLLFTDLGDKYIVRAGSSRGRELTKGKLFSFIIRDGRMSLTCNKSIADIKKLDQNFENRIWKRESKDCLFCNACIIACPSCFCFDMRDKLELEKDSGQRERHWDFCYMPSHSRVAGGHVFRKEPEERFRQRIYHHLKYFKKKYGRHLCVGCGRCISICPTDIDMVEIVNKLK